MPETLEEQIQRELTDALHEACTRELGKGARKGLQDFIVEAVIKGVDGDPGRYEQCREYLKCRFRYIGLVINERVDPARRVTWRQTVRAGSDEVALGNTRPDCIGQLVRVPGGGRHSSDGPGDHEARVRKALFLCVEYKETNLPAYPYPDDES